MLGSAIPKRWVVSLALVGLVSLFMASFSAVWANPASAGTTTTTTTTVAATSTPTSTPIPTSTPAPAGGNLVDLTVVTGLNLQAGQVVQLAAYPIDDLGDVNKNMLGLTYAWNAGSCGTLNSTTLRKVQFTALSSACSGTISVAAKQGTGAWVPAVGGAIIGISVAAPPATPVPTAVLTSADDGALVATDDQLDEILALIPELSADAKGAGVVPSQSAEVVDDTGNSVSISAGSLDSGDSKIVVVDKVELADLEAPPPPAATGSTSGTFKFGSSAIQITFLEGSSGDAISGTTKLNKPAQVCLSYTAADLAGAYGGPDGMKVWHHNGTEWVPLSTTVNTGSNRVCAWTSSFSPFALGLAVAPADADEVGTTGLPATGDYSPNALTIVMAMLAGFALVGTGVFTARRARRARENS